ncbi:hypothetical protein SE91_25920 [Bradyrhizobium sp. DOA1]|nr:hypothetical protein SE91_25920 [Bradyrhizobium sp. DOA1]
MLFEFMSNRTEAEGNTKLLQHRKHHAHGMGNSEPLEVRTHCVQSEFSHQEVDFADLDIPAQPSDMGRHAAFIVSDDTELRSRARPASNAFKGLCIKRPCRPVGIAKELGYLGVVGEL